jgi:CheY-specific phosphatase CheX
MNPPPDDPFALMDRQLAAATADLFGSYGLTVQRLPDHARGGLSSIEQSIVAIIGYAGEKVRGALVLVAARSTVERWLVAMGENTATTDVFDTVGEFSNMLLGRLKARLSPQGFPILLSTPTTASGSGLRLSNPPGPSSWLAFEGADWRLDVRMDATFDAGFVLQESADRSAAVDAGDMLLL